MTPNFEEILLELSYRVEGGIPNLEKQSHVNHLIDILRENGISDAPQLAQRARVYFSYLNEATPKKSVGNDTTIVINKKSKAVYPVKTSNFDSSVHDRATPAQINKAKKNGTFGNEEPKQQPTKQGPNAFGISGGGADVFPGNDTTPTPTPTSKPTSNKKVSNGGPAVTVPIEKDDSIQTSEKGAKEINSKKFQEAKKGNVTNSTISQEQGIQNVIAAYPGIKEHEYDYPKGVREYLSKVMHPAAFEAMDSLLKLSKGGDFVPPISLLTDQFGAGKIAAQMNELCMQGILAFPNTPQGIKARNEFIASLRANNDVIKKAGGTPILDNSWIDQFEGANDAFNNAMDREYGKGNWSVVGTTWDVRSQNEDMGINYDDKGFSTDINLQVQVNGKLQNVEISCKKDWKIFLLNGGLGKAENWYYTLGPKGEKRAMELAQKAEEKTISKEEAAELKKLNEQALSKAPVSNKELQAAQIKSANKGAQIIEQIEPKELTRIYNQYIKGDYENGVDKKGKVRPVDDPQFLKASIECHQSKGISNREAFLGCMKGKLKDFKGGDKYYKKAVVSIGAMLANTNTDDDMSAWYKSHMGITTKFIEKAADTLVNDKEYRKMILRKLQEAIPFKSLTNGVETMQIDGMYITQKHMEELFGTTDWNEVRQYLDVQVINGEGVLTYKAHGKKPNKPFPLASIDIREKGGGYDGNPALEVKPTKEFESAMKEIENNLNSTTRK